MAEKWDKKTVIEYAKALRSPFEDKTNGQRPKLAQLGDKIRQMIPMSRKV